MGYSIGSYWSGVAAPDFSNAVNALKSAADIYGTSAENNFKIVNRIDKAQTEAANAALFRAAAQAYDPYDVHSINKFIRDHADDQAYQNASAPAFETLGNGYRNAVNAQLDKENLELGKKAMADYQLLANSAYDKKTGAAANYAGNEHFINLDPRLKRQGIFNPAKVADLARNDANIAESKARASESGARTAAANFELARAKQKWDREQWKHNVGVSILNSIGYDPADPQSTSEALQEKIKELNLSPERKADLLELSNELQKQGNTYGFGSTKVENYASDTETPTGNISATSQNPIGTNIGMGQQIITQQAEDPEDPEVKKKNAEELAKAGSSSSIQQVVTANAQNAQPTNVTLQAGSNGLAQSVAPQENTDTSDYAVDALAETSKKIEEQKEQSETENNLKNPPLINSINKSLPTNANQETQTKTAQNQPTKESNVPSIDAIPRTIEEFEKLVDVSKDPSAQLKYGVIHLTKDYDRLLKKQASLNEEIQKKSKWLKDLSKEEEIIKYAQGEGALNALDIYKTSAPEFYKQRKLELFFDSKNKVSQEIAALSKESERLKPMIKATEQRAMSTWYGSNYEDQINNANKEQLINDSGVANTQQTVNAKNTIDPNNLTIGQVLEISSKPIHQQEVNISTQTKKNAINNIVTTADENVKQLGYTPVVVPGSNHSFPVSSVYNFINHPEQVLGLKKETENINELANVLGNMFVQKNSDTKSVLKVDTNKLANRIKEVYRKYGFKNFTQAAAAIALSVDSAGLGDYFADGTKLESMGIVKDDLNALNSFAKGYTSKNPNSEVKKQLVAYTNALLNFNYLDNAAKKAYNALDSYDAAVDKRDNIFNSGHNTNGSFDQNIIDTGGRVITAMKRFALQAQANGYKI